MSTGRLTTLLFPRAKPARSLAGRKQNPVVIVFRQLVATRLVSFQTGFFTSPQDDTRLVILRAKPEGSRRN